jgi:hypothetical protein
MKNPLASLLKLNVLLIAAFALLIPAHSPAFAQDETKPRSIDAEDFLKQRPNDAAGKPTQTGKGVKSTGVKKRPKYDLVPKEQKVTRFKNKTSRPSIKTPNPAQPTQFSEIGVTMWRLREARRSDKGAKIQDGNREWTPVRVGADTVFSEGDKVRIALESSVPGFLYIIDSEIFSNGGFGSPYLIFPAVEGEDNGVRPGLLIEIPDKSLSPPYFTINPKGENYVGELLTVIVSPQPLKNLKIAGDGRIEGIENLAFLEENTEVELYAKADGVGEIYTKAEAEAVCDQKTRQLERVKSEPCAKTRQLTREEPPPQNIYRVKSVAGQPAVLFVRLNVKQK